MKKNKMFVSDLERVVLGTEKTLLSRPKGGKVSVGESCDIDRAMEIDTERLHGLLHVIAWDVGYMYRPDKKASVILVTKDDESYDIVDLLECIRNKLGLSSETQVT